MENLHKSVAVAKAGSARASGRAGAWWILVTFGGLRRSPSSVVLQYGTLWFLSLSSHTEPGWSPRPPVLLLLLWEQGHRAPLDLSHCVHQEEPMTALLGQKQKNVFFVLIIRIHPLPSTLSSPLHHKPAKSLTVCFPSHDNRIPYRRTKFPCHVFRSTRLFHSKQAHY